MELEEPTYPIDEALRDAQAIVVAQVTSIEDPRWNSDDGSDWRVQFEQMTDEIPFTVPTPLTKVNIRVIDAIASGADPSVSEGDDLGVDFVLDPSLDVLQPLPGASDNSSSPDIDSPGIAARYLSPGDERVFLLEWRRSSLSDGWGEYGWHASILNGVWGMDGSMTVFPASRSQAEELARSDLQSVELVDWVTTEISMDDFQRLADEARRAGSPPSQQAG